MRWKYGFTETAIELDQIIGIASIDGVESLNRRSNSEWMKDRVTVADNLSSPYG